MTSEPNYLKEIFSFKQYVSENKTAPKFKESLHIKKILENLPDVSLSTVTLESSVSEFLDQTRKSVRKVSLWFSLPCRFKLSLAATLGFCQSC